MRRPGSVTEPGRTNTADPSADRAAILARLTAGTSWDLVVIGGGATGLGVALDAAVRGLSVALVEASDFACGTSSRSTKLVHGGVRYLAQGNVALVREALHERSVLLRNAPHLAKPLAFVMPSYRLWQTPFYGIGLKLYDGLAGRDGLGPTEWLGADRTRHLLPNLQTRGLSGGVRYWDGQFDDARLAVTLARTAAQRGAVLINHCPVVDLLHEGGRVSGVVAQDAETGRRITLRSRCVVNATGVWVDKLRQRDAEVAGGKSQPMVAPSQGVHLVVDQDFMPGSHALLVPKTADGRVLFGVPWMGKLVLGTTDTPVNSLPTEPRPLAEEVDFILREASRYLARAPQASDVRSAWAGMRPLVKPTGSDGGKTGSISREHTVLVSRSGLVTVTGGNWTTYRAMAEDVIAQCVASGLLPRRAGSTVQVPLVGATGGSKDAQQEVPSLGGPPGLHLYGSEADRVGAMPGHDRQLGGGLTEAMVAFAADHEYARTVEDVLARRSRLLFTDARMAGSLADQVGALLIRRTGVDPRVAAFKDLAARYATL